MEGFVFLIFIIIIFNVITSATKKNKTKYQTRSPWKPEEYQPHTRSDPKGQSRKDFASRSKAASKELAKQELARQARRKLRDKIDSRASKRRDVADQNRNRAYDWGERAGPGFFTFKNMLVLIVFGFIVLYIMSMFPANS